MDDPRNSVANEHPAAVVDLSTQPDGAQQKRAASPPPGRKATWPDSPSPEAYHGLAGELTRIVDPHTEADRVAILVQFLVAFGDVVGRGPYFPVEADRHRVNLFAVLVGPTAKGRKGTSWGHVLRRFEAVDPAWPKRVQSGLSSGEGLIHAVRDPDDKGDLGVTDKRLLAMEPEFASTLRVLGREGNTLSAQMRQAWDTGDLRVLTKNQPVQATGAHISLISHITAGELRSFLTSTEAGNGFANRILWCCVRRSKLLPEGGSIDGVDFNPFDARLQEAIAFGRTIEEMKRDEEARKLWRQVYPSLSEGRPGLLGAVTSRAEAQVVRLAAVYALLDQSSVVRQEHLAAALALWRYSEESARFVFGQRLGDPVAETILRTLKATPNGMSLTEIHALFSNHKEAIQIEAALANLSEQGLVSFEKRAGTGGRPTERWHAIQPAK